MRLDAHQEVHMDRLLTIKKFCELYGVGRSTVYRENAAGRLPFRKIGRATRIAESDAKKWVDFLPAR
jgi:excisionase family DNA binding protein